MINGGDKAITVLFRVCLVICVFLVFGMVLNGVVVRRDKILEEKDHRTSIRIALIREEYERKIGDLRLKYKQVCEQTVQEAVERIKLSAKEALDKHRAEIEKAYAHKVNNQSDEIQRLNEELRQLTNSEVHPISKEERLSTIEEIEKHIADLKLRISQKPSEDTDLGHDDDVLFNAEQQEILHDVTNRLADLEKTLGHR